MDTTETNKAIIISLDELSTDQLNDLLTHYQINEVSYLPDALRQLLYTIPPFYGIDECKNYLYPIISYINSKLHKCIVVSCSILVTIFITNNYSRKIVYIPVSRNNIDDGYSSKHHVRFINVKSL